MAGEWIQVRFKAERGLAEGLSAALGEVGAMSVALSDSGDTPVYEPAPGESRLWEATDVTALFPDRSAVRAALAALRARGWRPLPPHELEAVADRDWAAEWHRRLEPLRFGTRLWICPAPAPAPSERACVVELEPGIAFGTGTHPTTALCLEWLEGIPLQGCAVVDYGSGSGILGLAALALGAERVWAVDHDEQAREATERNARRNAMAERLQVFAPEDFPSVRADVVMANILLDPLRALAPELARMLVPGGRIALSGVLAEQADALGARYAERFELDAPVECHNWVLVSGRLRTG